MMAVVRARAGRGPLEKAFDSAALAKDAARLGAADFAQLPSRLLIERYVPRTFPADVRRTQAAAYGRERA